MFEKIVKFFTMKYGHFFCSFLFFCLILLLEIPAPGMLWAAKKTKAKPAASKPTTAKTKFSWKIKNLGSGNAEDAEKAVVLCAENFKKDWVVPETTGPASSPLYKFFQTCEAAREKDSAPCDTMGIFSADCKEEAFAIHVRRFLSGQEPGACKTALVRIAPFESSLGPESVCDLLKTAYKDKSTEPLKKMSQSIIKGETMDARWWYWVAGSSACAGLEETGDLRKETCLNRLNLLSAALAQDPKNCGESTFCKASAEKKISCETAFKKLARAYCVEDLDFFLENNDAVPAEIYKSLGSLRQTLIPVP